ncbi:MAG: hypothetical protein ACT4QE_08525, partial [Anaerolineales bacterium]
MFRKLITALLALTVVGCQTSSPTPPPTAQVSSVTPAPPVPPTATSLAEGLPIRLATPDPSPNCPEHYPWFFNNTANECATTVLNTWGVLQWFERGLMVWFQEGGRTYLLLEDGSLFKPYVEATDAANSPLPETDPNIVPPDGRYQPVLGFGKFWRGQVPGYEWVRERLGWATAPEVGYSALLQCNNTLSEAARCYFTGPRD